MTGPIDVLRFFFSPDDHERIRTVINLLIVAMVVRGVAQVWRELQAIRWDREALRKLEGRDDMSDVAAVLTAANTLDSTSLVRKRIGLWASQVDSAGAIDRSYLSSVSAIELGRRAPFARWAASTTVLVGLGGTLIGLSVALTKTIPLLQTQESTSNSLAINAVIDTFSGLGTAFSCTLMGVLGAFVLSASLSRLRIAQADLLEQLDGYSMTALYPRFAKSQGAALDAAVTAIEDVGNDIRLSMAKLTRKMVRQGQGLRQSVGSELQLVVGELRVGIAQTVEAVESAMGALVAETSSKLSETTQTLTSATEAVHRLTGSSGKVRTLAATLETLQSGVDSMQLAATTLERVAPAIAEAIATESDRQTRDLNEAMTNYVLLLQKAGERQSIAFEQGVATLAGEVRQFPVDALEMLRRQGEAFEATLARTHDNARLMIERHSRELASSVQVIQTEVQRVPDMALSLIQQQGVQLETAIERSQQAAKDIAATQSALHEAMSVTASKLMQAANKLTDIGAREPVSRASRHGLADDLVTSLSSLNESINALREQIQQRSNSASGRESNGNVGSRGFRWFRRSR